MRRRQHVLGTTGGVLGGATRDEFGIAVVDQVLVQAHLFGLSLGVHKQGVVELETILLQQVLVTGIVSVRTMLEHLGRFTLDPGYLEEDSPDREVSMMCRPYWVCEKAGME